MDIVKNSSGPFAAFQVREFSWFILARLTLILAAQMQYLIISWQIYSLTKHEFKMGLLSLGLIGLVELIPFVFTSLIGGFVADIVDRKKIIIGASVFFLLGSILLFYFTLDTSTAIQTYGTLPLYAIVFMTGIARGFIGPTYFAVLTQIVSRELVPNAVTWSATTFHIAAVAGPAAGGLMVGLLGYTNSYAVVIALVIMSIIFAFLLKKKPIPIQTKKESLLASLSTGIKFVAKNQLVLSSLSLDLFAVLFGGAVAMLPAFADKILHTGPVALGLLRAAPAFGAVIMAGILAYRIPKRSAGPALLWSVFAFGVCMILFAISENLYLSLFILALSGAFDNVSVVLRQIILQFATPDEMRGRVAAVNGIFIGSSNELGAFESGVAAFFLGLVPSVIVGGCITVGIVGYVTKVSPKLRTLNLQELQDQQT